MPAALLVACPEETAEAPAKVVLMTQPMIFSNGDIIVSIDFVPLCSCLDDISVDGISV